MYLVDTNVVSELRSRQRRDPNVVRWSSGVPDASLFISVLVVGEIQIGIERIRRRGGDADALASWANAMEERFADRILPVTRHIVRRWAELTAVRTLPVVDGLLAATASVHALTFVTRNVRDVRGLGITTLNPFEPTGS